MAITFHLDEHIPPALANSLRHRDIDVTTTADTGLMGAEDREHLAYATNASRVQPRWQAEKWSDRNGSRPATGDQIESSIRVLIV